MNKVTEDNKQYMLLLACIPNEDERIILKLSNKIMTSLIIPKIKARPNIITRIYYILK